MEITAQCPHCFTSYRLAAEAAGRQAKCRCGQMFTVSSDVRGRETISRSTAVNTNQAVRVAVAKTSTTKHNATVSSPHESEYEAPATRIPFAPSSLESGAYVFAGWALWAVALLTGFVATPLLAKSAEQAFAGMGVVVVLAIGCVVMVGVDAHKQNLQLLGRSRLDLTNLERMTPLGWTALTAMLWAIVFPIYLFKRPRLVAAVNHTYDNDLYMTEEQESQEAVKSGRASSLARLSLIFACFGVVPWIGSYGLGVCGLVMAVVALGMRKPGRGMAIAAIVISLIFPIGYTVLFASLGWFSRPNSSYR